MPATAFVERHGLWTAAQAEACRDIRQVVRERGLESIRLSFADLHGILRGKTFTVAALDDVLENGCTLTSTLLLKDTAHRTVFPVWERGAGMDRPEFTGAGDFVLVPDPATFRVLPWVEKTGWLLCDAYFRDGTPVDFSTRRILREALAALAGQGYQYVAGIELEFSVYRMEDPRLAHEDCGQPASPPRVAPLAHGFQYLTEHRYDELQPLLEKLREALVALGLPLRSLEAEFGPSQVELTFSTVTGLEAADNVMLARSAIKQVCRRNGCHATFMCRPALPNAFSNGWHLHQSLADARSGANAFVSTQPDSLLSPTGSAFLAGLLAHAREACILSTPTINGYKRYRPWMLAPNRIVWGFDNRGAMLRVVGRPGDPSTHIENRLGEPAANPYLYMTSQIVCGRDGMENGLKLPEGVDNPYDEGWDRLPRNLLEAVRDFRESRLFRGALGDRFVDYLAAIKDFELNRFLSEEVTDWEQREYFENF